jgi:cell division transport system permease protein
MRRQRRRPSRPIPVVAALQDWLAREGRAALETLDRLIDSPLGTLMTVGAIAIALALPATLFVALQNIERLGGSWDQSAAVSLFLAEDVTDEEAAEMASLIGARADIVQVELISKEAGLAEFREYSGLGAALDHLSENPLPAVLSIHPAPEIRTRAQTQALLAALEALPGADFARLDTQWAQRFHAIVALLRTVSLLIGCVLGLTVLLVVGNTIRLEIENRRGEVQIMDLVGATRGFIRRPFLYSGAWYGLLGGIGAWLMVGAAVLWLQEPVGHLADLYHTQFDLSGLDLRASAALLAAGVLMGTLGSWIAVGRHLSHVEPD